MPLDPPWQLWRLFTYVFISPVSFFSPFSLLFFYWASVGIETHLGRIVLTRLLVLLALAPLAVAAIGWRGFNHSSIMDGRYRLLGRLIVAFATLYPNTEAWGWVPYKWVAFACILCGSFMLLAVRGGLEVGSIFPSFAAGFIRIPSWKLG